MFDPQRVFLGITPTCWTNDDFQDDDDLGRDIPFARCVDEIAKADFQGCSIGHKFPKEVDELIHELSRRRLKVSEPWVSTCFTEDKFEATLAEFRRRMKFVKKVGGQDIGVAEFGNSIHLDREADLESRKPVFTEDQWKALTTGLNVLGNLAAGESMRLCYHPHMGTGVQTQDDVERLMRETNDNVHLLLDTGHLTWAGASVVRLIKDYSHRIPHVHLKNIRDEPVSSGKNHSFYEHVKAGVFTVPGDVGIVDFPQILRQLDLGGFTGWLVVEAEQGTDQGEPLDFARTARRYLRQVTGL
ncbi:myo-inosose-2 dehydratase [Saccharothrix sp. ALI-22-I]|uniref:myo-inosose-2 dehydratase n=1 Tax=Saccharothrix sp. ALI-22-I TaxID=1933778 RepID=UPI00097BB9BC|nr:myo-inosose-2 dehydratase [Saccharothrix sp. ALI-22-I]ONI90720.1 myo-inosose-2 dehydratase [Saccharothrix sp. ALI-22-I]